MKTLKNYYMLVAALLVASIAAAQMKNTNALNEINFDKEINLKDDFYNHVNGGWLQNNEIPNDKTSWGGLTTLREQAQNDMIDILNQAIQSQKYTDDTPQGKAIILYETMIDTVSRNKMGLKPLKKYFSAINKIRSKSDLETYIVSMVIKGGGGLFMNAVFTDLANSTMNTVYLGGSPLGLPDRDYYLDTTANAINIRDKYKDYIEKMAKILAAESDMSLGEAERIINFETLLAKETMPRQEARNPQKIYNPMTIAQLSEKASYFNWKKYFAALSLTETDRIIVTDVNYVTAIGTILDSTEIEDWKGYLKWLLLKSYSSFLTTELSYANWEFFSKELNGTTERKPFETRNVNMVNNLMGMALGKLYVDKRFSPEAKTRAKEIIANVVEAFKNRIDRLDWMSQETKIKAQEKLSNYTLKIGYPDIWKDYSSLQLVNKKDGGTYIDNIEAITQWLLKEMFNKIGQPVDKSEWIMSPQTVNAYYNKVNNEIVFPAAILQAPYFDVDADAAVNYGAIGAIVGHEITHGFDDSGAKFDKDGNFSNWWKQEDYAQFNVLSEKLAKQYSEIELFPEFNINGKLTLGENIADIGGVEAAFEALKIELKKQGKTPKIDGYTQEERFFFAWATAWRSKTREKAAKNLLKVDTHSPNKIRGYIPLQHIDAFYEVFDIKLGDKMFLKPEDRVSIW